MVKYLQFKKSDLDKLKSTLILINGNSVMTRITHKSPTELILRIENRVSDENVVYDFIDELESEFSNPT